MSNINTFFTAFFLLIICGVAEAGKNKPLTPEYILKQELALNQLIVNIHLLQMDFQNQGTREQLKVQLTLLDNEIPHLPKQSDDQELDGLLSSTLALWPAISHHTTWMANLPPHSEPPQAKTLLTALAKLDRKLLLLRQKLMIRSPEQNDHLDFLEQALLMQRMTREYITLTKREHQEDKTLSGRMQLKTLADNFGQNLSRLNQEFGTNRHAAESIKQTRAAWNFIKPGIYLFPRMPVPELVARYNDRIVGRLTSIHQMF